jgi:hypothetical protein
VSRTGFCIRFISSVILAILCGCVFVPVRTPVKSKSVSGQIGKKLDLEFIKLGVTTRQEIDQKLGWIDVGLKDDKVFLGRWADSSWGVAWAIAGGYTGKGGWNRVWSIHNLVLYLNERGIVQQKFLIPDTEIMNTLSVLTLRDPGRSLDLSVPIELPVEYIRPTEHIAGRLVLGKDEFMFLAPKLAYAFKTSPQNIRHLRMGKRAASDAGNPENVCVKIHFKQHISVGDHMTVQLNLPATMTLLVYTQQIQSRSSSNNPPRHWKAA